MEPATSIIKKLGGGAKVAEILSVSRSQPTAWCSSREKRGTAGRIPQRHIPILLDYAKMAGIDLRLEEFFPQPAEAAE